MTTGTDATMGPTASRLDVRLSKVTSKDDIEALAEINERALEGDPLKTWMVRYTERTEYDGTVKAVTAALTDPKCRLIKATVTREGCDVVVGFVHWENGWIELEKTDPFAQKQASEHQANTADVKDVTKMPEELEAKGHEVDTDRQRRLKRGEEKYIHTRNYYIAAIRGKKHNFIRRLMVLPEYQGYGIGKQLLQVVTREADEQKIACWLFSRPKGEPLYEKVGFISLGETSMDEPDDDFVCPRTLAMMRQPQVAS